LRRRRKESEMDEEMVSQLEAALTPLLGDDEELAKEVVASSRRSMGVELEDEDVENILMMANQVS